jgi:hypothetical protein
MYSHISRNSAANKKPLTSGAEFGEYSTLFHQNIPEAQPRREGSGRAVDQITQDDKKAVHTQEGDTPVDQLYAQVDKKKRRHSLPHTRSCHTSGPAGVMSTLEVPSDDGFSDSDDDARTSIV